MIRFAFTQRRAERRMHILLGLLGAIGVVGVILWRLNTAAQAARGLTETAEDARGLYRRWSWRRKLASDPLELVSDPREAAVAMMVAIAQHDGALTERERSAILTEAARRFEATANQSEELLAHGRWLTREVRDPDRCLQKLRPLIQRTCSPTQMDDVISMLRAVATADGRTDETASTAIDRLDGGLNRSVKA